MACAAPLIRLSARPDSGDDQRGRPLQWSRPARVRRPVHGHAVACNKGSGHGFFGDPACSGLQARVVAVVWQGECGVESIQDDEALVPAAGDELGRAVHSRSLPQRAEPFLPVVCALVVAPLPQQSRDFGQVGALAQDPHGVGGQFAGSQSGGVAVGQPGLQLGDSGEGVQVVVGYKTDGRNTHIRSAPLGPRDGRLLPGQPPRQVSTGAQAGVTGRPVVVRAGGPRQESLPQQVRQDRRIGVRRIVQGPRDRQCHLGVIGNQRRLAIQLTRPGRPVPILDLRDRQELRRACPTRPRTPARTGIPMLSTTRSTPKVRRPA